MKTFYKGGVYKRRQGEELTLFEALSLKTK